jgi:P2-related tail formation protein
MSFAPIQLAAQFAQIASNYNSGSSDSISAPFASPIPAGTPIPVFVTYKGVATPTVTDSEGNTYNLVESELLTVSENCYIGYFLCSSGRQPVSPNLLTVSVNTSVNVTALFVVALQPQYYSANTTFDLGSIHGNTSSGTTSDPTITTTLANTDETLLVMVYGGAGGGSVTAQTGWTNLASNANGAMLVSKVVTTSGSYVAQPCVYPGTPPVTMVCVAMISGYAPIGLTTGSNGKLLPQGETELRNFGDTISAMQASVSWGYPFCTGVTLRVNWSDLQPNPPTGNAEVDFEWAYIDAALAQAQSYGKIIGLILGLGESAPSWVLSSGCTLFYISTDEAYVPAPWDQYYQVQLTYLVNAIAQRYDNNPNLAYVTMSGFGWHDGMAFCRSTADNNALYATTYNGVTGLQLLQNAFEAICLIYLTAFQKTRLELIFYSPINPDNYTTQPTVVPWVQWLLGVGGSQVGIDWHNLGTASWFDTGNESDNFVPYGLIQEYSVTNLNGVQPEHATSSDIPNLIIAASSIGASFLETYIGQLEYDTSTFGVNWQGTAAMLNFVAEFWKPFTPYTPPLPPPAPTPIPSFIPANPIAAPIINPGVSLESIPGGSLVDYLNPLLQQDAASVTLMQTLDELFSQMVDLIPLNTIYANLPNQPEAVLDFLAVYCFNTDFYDYSLSYAQKLWLVQNCILFKEIKGTKAVLEMVISNLYANAKVIQWFEPGFSVNGSPPVVPYTFRLNIGGDLTNQTLLNKINALVLAYKNVRSLCVTINPISFGNTTNYVGVAASCYRKYIVWSS